MVTWPMTSRDPERLRSWPQYAYGPVSRKRQEIRTWFQWTTNRKWPTEIRMVTWLMTSRDRDRWRSWPNIFGAHYLDNGWWYGLGGNGEPIGNGYLGNMVTWSIASRDPERSKLWHLRYDTIGEFYCINHRVHVCASEYGLVVHGK